MCVFQAGKRFYFLLEAAALWTVLTAESLMRTLQQLVNAPPYCLSFICRTLTSIETYRRSLHWFASRNCKVRLKCSCNTLHSSRRFGYCTLGELSKTKLVCFSRWCSASTLLPVGRRCVPCKAHGCTYTYLLCQELRIKAVDVWFKCFTFQCSSAANVLRDKESVTHE